MFLYRSCTMVVDLRIRLSILLGGTCSRWVVCALKSIILRILAIFEVLGIRGCSDCTLVGKFQA